MKRIVLISILFICGNLIYSQYLEVSRPAAIKKDPKSNSKVIEKVQKGDSLVLFDNGKQADGYYKVKCNTTDQQGWIYRTLVRRYKDALPSDRILSSKTDSVTDVLGIGQIPIDYYSNISGLSGQKLKHALHKIIRNHKVISYNEVWDALTYTDEDPSNLNNLILIYSLRSQPKNQRDRGTNFNYEANGYTLNDSWNREHVWSKSHGFPEEGDTAYTDLHHLRPEDRSTNSARNERSFDYCTEKYFDNGGTSETDCSTSTTKWIWEPPDKVKGDIARMIFYMDVRYEGYLKDGKKLRDLTVVDKCPEKGTSDPIMGKLSTLLEWNRKDPVDNFERERNEVIYKKYQGNRNPFIDHPEYVDLIWKHK
jgi:endonuclease I